MIRHPHRRLAPAVKRHSLQIISALVVHSLAVSILVTPSVATAAPAAVEVLYLTVGYDVGATFNSPLGIFYDTHHDECYIADTGNHQIVVCDANGMPLYRFYHRVEVDGREEMGEPRGVAVDRDGRIFVTDALANYLDVLDHRGLRVQRIDAPDDGCGQPARFEALALAPDNTVYASIACAEPRVAVIGDDLEIARIIALRGPDHATPCITGMSIDAEMRIYITNPCAEHMVQVYEPDGRYLTGFGRHDSGWENFSFPAGIAVTNSGDIWIVDALRQVASCFDLQGRFLSYLGGKGTELGAFTFPSAVATDGEGLVFVLERGGNRLQCFRFVEEDS
jgi:sugar lactone lactonase YvrE